MQVETFQRLPQVVPTQSHIAQNAPQPQVIPTGAAQRVSNSIIAGADVVLKIIEAECKRARIESELKLEEKDKQLKILQEQYVNLLQNHMRLDMLVRRLTREGGSNSTSGNGEKEIVDLTEEDNQPAIASAMKDTSLNNVNSTLPSNARSSQEAPPSSLPSQLSVPSLLSQSPQQSQQSSPIATSAHPHSHTQCGSCQLEIHQYKSSLSRLTVEYQEFRTQASSMASRALEMVGRLETALRQLRARCNCEAGKSGMQSLSTAVSTNTTVTAVVDVSSLSPRLRMKKRKQMHMAMAHAAAQPNGSPKSALASLPSNTNDITASPTLLTPTPMQLDAQFKLLEREIERVGGALCLVVEDGSADGEAGLGSLSSLSSLTSLSLTSEEVGASGSIVVDALSAVSSDSTVVNGVNGAGGTQIVSEAAYITASRAAKVAEAMDIYKSATSKERDSIRARTTPTNDEVDAIVAEAIGLGSASANASTGTGLGVIDIEVGARMDVDVYNHG